VIPITVALFCVSLLASSSLRRPIASPEDVPLPADDSWMNCYAIVAGKDCTVDGSVIFAHNEDSGSGNPVHFWKVPAQEHQDIETQRLVNGGSEPFAAKTLSYIWCQMPGLRYSDTYFNEHGVAVASNGCHSRENKPELTDGGITYMLRRIVAARATSARHGVKIAAGLVLTYGYADTGRTMTIADGKEAWIMNLVRGKHWAAARVPDDKFAAVANHYTIHRVDPGDKKNFNLSPGLIEYAKKRGWYEPKRDGEFDFATVYGSNGARLHGSNIRRVWRGYSLLGKGEFEESWRLPTFVEPAKKLKVSDLMGVLRDHYEGTKYDTSESYSKCSPNSMGPTICAGGTSFSTVFQLRGDMPPSIGAVMWISMCRPDASIYVPWYAGIQKIPLGLSEGRADDALRDHFDPAYKKLGQPTRFATVCDFGKRLGKVYGKFFPRLDKARDALEAELLRKQPEVDATARRLHQKDPQAALDYLTSYTLAQQSRAYRMIRKWSEELRYGR
jgi:dipeptidase